MTDGVSRLDGCTSGYRRLGDLQAASDAELLELRNFGYLSLAEVRAVGR